ncbi:hypothetical protein E3N88_35172 [Mikania micrantha]|uniref:Uncharacterized protein n=1 Tax=Mikania micrantha TaxID=192012 RepID=A0A5N6M0L7_9ASTR|nr:hypothetical protein E3N88_35172 [Mikania micrantha]
MIRNEWISSLNDRGLNDENSGVYGARNGFETRKNECPEYQQFCEDVKQQIYESDYYYQDFLDASCYPPSSDYQIGFILGANYISKTQRPNNHELFSFYQYEDEARIARLELRIYKIDEYLSAPNISVQQQVHYLEMKCEFLKMKIQIEESISPLPEDIRSYWEEEVVEMITTSNFSPDEEPRVECLVVDDEIEKIIVLPNPPSKLILLINKCGDEHLKTRISSVKSQHIRQAIMEGNHINIYFRYFFYTSTVGSLNWIWHANYRAYLGNAIGKCSIRPP